MSGYVKDMYRLTMWLSRWFLRNISYQLKEGYEIALTGTIGTDQNIEWTEFYGRLFDGPKTTDLNTF